MKKVNKKISRQIGFPVFVSAVVFLLLLIYGGVANLSDTRDELLEEPARIALNAGREIEGSIKGLSENMELIASSASVVGVESVGMKTFLQKVLEIDPSVLEISVYDSSGDFKYRVGSSLLRGVVYENEVGLLDKVHSVVEESSAITFSPEESKFGNLISVWSMPIFAEGSASVEYVVNLVYDISSLESILNRYNKAGLGNLYVVNKEGELLAYSRGLSKDNEINLDNAGVSSFLAGNKVLNVYSGLLGVTVVGTWEELSAVPWGLLVEIPIDSLMGQVGRNITLLVLTIIVFILMAFILTYKLRGVLIRPIQSLVGVIKKFRGGSLSIRSEVEADNEVGVLSENFNEMADELEVAYTGLEEKVEERTAQLNESLVQVKKQSEILKQKAIEDEAIFESIGDGLVFIDKDRKILRMNRLAMDLVGCDESACMTKLWPDILSVIDNEGKEIPYEEMPSVVAMKKRRMVSISPFTTNVNFINLKEVKYPVSVVAAPVVIDGELHGGIVAFRNVTKEKEIDRARNEFISFASHQLRTPMTSMKWTLELLLKGKFGELGEEVRGKLDSLVTVNDDMISLVSTLLSISKIELGVVSEVEKEVFIKELIEKIFKENEELILKKNLKMVVSDIEVPVVYSDEKMWKMVLGNLINNACKYSKEGGEVKVSVKSEKNNSVLVAVSDSGMGIPEDEKELIFSKSFRGKNVSKEVQGTGLGLYIVKSIVMMLGGEVDFESKVGKGTTFFVRLPVKKKVDVD